MAWRTFWKKSIAVLTLSCFTLAISGCGVQSTTSATKPGTPRPSAQAGSTTGPGAESKSPGAEVPDAAPAKTGDDKAGEEKAADDKVGDEKPASE